ncbi:MAG: GAF domain-containing protein [Acidobacteria bacterium]|nr:GAF domain-containing protein [Acidobacteriota bacterium]MDW7984448.1 GAF domain-containing protein [Acidobacteriota bacterium]
MKTPMEVLQAIDAFLARRPEPAEALQFVIDTLHRERPHYHWVGIYLLEPDGAHLRLHDYYVGRPTPHTRIPVTEGICGAAVREGQTIVVPDVSQDPRYLACSLETRSEIVVPIWRGNRIVGEIDVDSDDLAAFGEEDRQLLEAVAERLAPWLPPTE